METCPRCGDRRAGAAVRFCTSCGAAFATESSEPSDELVAPPGSARRLDLRWPILVAGAVVAVGVVAVIVFVFRGGAHPAAIGTTAATSTTAGTGTAAGTSTPISPESMTAPPGRSTTVDTSQAFAPPSGVDAPTVVENYYDAINRRDYQTAWRLGGDSFGMSYTAFVNGFANTANDVLTITAVSGNTVSVRLVALQNDGTSRYYTGTYTVGNGVLTGHKLTPSTSTP